MFREKVAALNAAWLKSTYFLLTPKLRFIHELARFLLYMLSVILYGVRYEGPQPGLWVRLQALHSETCRILSYLSLWSA
jgi:hypothetical protein